MSKSQSIEHRMTLDQLINVIVAFLKYFFSPAEIRKNLIMKSISCYVKSIMVSFSSQLHSVYCVQISVIVWDSDDQGASSLADRV